ncbi:hypothetical protein PDE_05662 [Penicillium oxalicum 114-2]|uniref:Uncharacterized protein n=1 Tax=Penicillium oxalicum (strain 114-2 / CGMCC 5302) TaxID=933388 RepID=S7ZJ93_PENO1|nr:hypothetical protein PDE_05662 [Penicillium oxalicum 114-2]
MSKKKSSGSGKAAKPKTQSVGWIWPKDPQPGNSSHWPRFKRFSDVISGKGPDIFIGTIGKTPRPVANKDSPGRTISSTNWARWDVDPEEHDTPFSWARRDKDVRYDYKTRKYGVPNERTWSAVEYADCQWGEGKWRKKKVTPTAPIRFWDQHGREHRRQGPVEVARDGRIDIANGVMATNGCDGHCQSGRNMHDSGFGNHDHMWTHTHVMPTHCPGCCCEIADS